MSQRYFRHLILLVSAILYSTNSTHGQVLLPPYDTQNWEVFFADIDGDGKVDKIVRNINSGDVFTHKNIGGKFSPYADYVDYGRSVADYNNWLLEFADINGDGRADLINISPGTANMYVHYNNGGGSSSLFNSVGTWYGAVTNSNDWRPFFPKLHLSGTNRADVCNMYLPSGQIWCHANTGSNFNPTYSFTQTGVAAPAYAGSGWGQFFADVDGDGYDDYVDQYYSENQFWVHKYNPGSGFAVASTYGGFGPAEKYEYQYFWGNVDSDTKADLIQLNLRSGDILGLASNVSSSGTLAISSTGALRDAAPAYDVPTNRFSLITASYRSLNHLMWYDIDYLTAFGRSTSNPGWFNLYSSSPSSEPSPGLSGIFRGLDPLLRNSNGTLYSSNNTAAIKQHAYWLKALGMDGIVIDLTNTDLASSNTYTTEVLNATNTLLATYSTMKEVIPPKVIIAIRIHGSDTTSATNLANWIQSNLVSVYGSQAFYKFNDGSGDRSKPVLLVFPDQIASWTSGPTWSNANFNVRFSGGGLSYVNGFATYSSQNDYKTWNNNYPYWSFWEPVPAATPNYVTKSSPIGNYQIFTSYSAVFRKLPADPSILEQSSTWNAIFQGNSNLSTLYTWDSSDNLAGGLNTIRRVTLPLFFHAPRIILWNRFNYSYVRTDYAGEGISGYKSNMIEPTTQLGFNNMIDVGEVSYSIKDWFAHSSGNPIVEAVSCCSGTCKIKFKSSAYLIETLVSSSSSGSGGTWLMFDVNTNTATLPSSLTPNAFWLWTRNIFGQSSSVMVSGYSTACTF